MPAKFFERLEDAPPINTPLAKGGVVAVFCGDDVLLDCRKDGGLWAFPGGKAEPGETPLECAARELFEETGLSGLDLQFVKLFDNPGSIGVYPYGNVVQTHFTLFSAVLDTKPEIKISEESTQMCFVPIKELANMDIAASHNPIVRWILNDRKKMSDELTIRVEESSKKGRFFVDLGDGYEAEMTYVRNENQMIIDHTGVPKPFEGKGIAAHLVFAGVDFARQNNRKIVPVCSYAVLQFKRHKEWADVLAS
jgi:8-oxo-dGTP pyrophosphatase MutT (NUDIX family)/predicted GNAT family acetyltransferase